MKTYYVYVLREVDTHRIKWVGQTENPHQRTLQHRSIRLTGNSNANESFLNWLCRTETEPELEVVCVVGSLSESLRVEKELILAFRSRGEDLLNGEPGGGKMSLQRKLEHGTMLRDAHQARPGASAKTEEHKEKLRAGWTEERRLAHGRAVSEGIRRSR